MGFVSRGLRSCSVSRGSVRGRCEGGRGLLSALASQTQKRDEQVLDLSQGFGDSERLP